MQLFFIFLLLLPPSHVTMVTVVAGCHGDRDRHHRPRETCAAAGFGDVPAGIELSTQVLSFPNNMFSSLSWSSFQIFTEIYEIDLTGNKVPTVTSAASPILPTLRVLRLSSNRLTSLADNSFSACPGLTELYLDKNAIGSLSDHAFSGLGKLEILDLSSNHIKVLPKLMLHPLPNIETLILENNKITVMPDDWFSKKEEVPYLYLSANPWACSCSLGYLRRYLDDYEYNVYVRDGVIITCDGESVVCDSPPWHKGTPVVNLEESDLCSASTPSGPTGDFNQPVTTNIPYTSRFATAAVPTTPPPPPPFHPEGGEGGAGLGGERKRWRGGGGGGAQEHEGVDGMVTAVAGCHSDRDRDHRPRETCTAAGFGDVPAGFELSTQVLSFPNNMFSSLSWSSFQIFTEIYEIDLTGNKVPTVTSAASPILPTLRVLRLSSNRLTSLANNSFSACPGLTELYLDKNAIGSLSDHAFSGLGKLEILDLSSNHIKVLPKLMLHPLPNIETLILENNKITVMPDDWFSKKEEVPYLYLSANPWACSCSLGYLRRYLDDYEYNVYVRDGVIITCDGESVVCDSPPWHKGTPVLHLEESDLCSASTPSGPTGDFNQPVTTNIPYTSRFATAAVPTTPPPPPPFHPEGGAGLGGGRLGGERKRRRGGGGAQEQHGGVDGTVITQHALGSDRAA